MNYNRKIAAAIIAAQSASNTGKDKPCVETNRTHTNRSAGFLKYDIKVDYILRAINLINGAKTLFNYYVVKSPDQNGYSSIITYFTFRIDNVKYQVSFHTPLNLAGALMPHVGKGLRMRWDRKNSNYACEMLAQAYNL